ncbi:MAG: amino acid ABC transporter substrate-binding protein [Aestuariivirga sp.]|uniref:amino acid ABC transporter substrate-binding protein n=1 Tax=Aestuariivirga sp. TaxID=2650926 RepID=UPI0038D18C2D
MTNKLLSFLFGAAVSLVAAGAASAGTLDEVRQRDAVLCGVSTGLPGFSVPDSQNNWTGMDVDFCRAVAAAVLGDASKVKFTPLSAKERFTALQSGDIDILSRNTTWTMSRDTSSGLKFAGIMYYDGQGFMINKTKLPNVKSAMDLAGATVCTQSGTTTELNLADFFSSNNMEYKLVTYEKNDDALAAYQDGRCDAYSTDQSGLYAQRLKFTNPDDHIVLPEIISKEPLGPVVRQGDDAWFNIVKWTYFALVNAEELGITSQNVEQIKTTSKDPQVKRLLGVPGEDGTSAGFGTGIGLEESWAENAIKAVGNYGEIFERNVGANSPLKIARGKNALWSDGGLQYAPPVR